MMNKKVLVAEKDWSTLSLIETRLGVRGYDVAGVSSSEEAMRQVQKERFDLVLISSRMERVGGMDLASRMKRGLIGLGTPVILLVEKQELGHLILTEDRGFDDFLIKPLDPLSFQLRVALNLSRARDRLFANPLTGLPGSIAIEKMIKQQLDEDEFFSVCYMDIGHFKSFNDRYGFERGDAVIRQLARLMTQTLHEMGAEEHSFVGHVGGDDFVVILDPQFETRFSETCLETFDRLAPAFYDEADRKRGCITAKDRDGVLSRFPLMSLSIAAVTNQYRTYHSLSEIARDAAEVKAFLKTQKGSRYLRDRRGEPLASLEESIELLSAATERRRRSSPLGQTLVKLGLINQDQLTQAVRRHAETGERLGQVLIRMGAIASDQLGHVLERKFGVDYVPLMDYPITDELRSILDEQFIRAHRVFPLARTKRRMDLAMVDPRDKPLIQTVRQMTGLRVVPKLALENEFEEFLERLS